MKKLFIKLLKIVGITLLILLTVLLILIFFTGPNLPDNTDTIIDNVINSELPELVKGKSVHTDNCLGCGHCEAVCPNGAISIKFEEKINIDEVMKEIIQRYEKIVDISG